jgi:hypothetical protein
MTRRVFFSLSLNGNEDDNDFDDDLKKRHHRKVTTFASKSLFSPFNVRKSKLSF